MPHVHEYPSGLLWTRGDAHLLVEAAGRDAARVRASFGRPRDGLPGALLESDQEWAAVVELGGRFAAITVGLLRVQVDIETGLLTFLRSTDRRVLFAEKQGYEYAAARRFMPRGAGRYGVHQYFQAYDDEKLFGLGQHSHGYFDQKNTVTELAQTNTEVSIPFLLSSRGYGFLWNTPALGRVELGRNETRWSADQAEQIDYWVTASAEPLRILSAYADATGHAPAMPDWATGYWQSKLRYTSQHELLEVAREYARRGIPLSVIVADYFHWTHLGDLRFDPVTWPDPEAMTRELAEYGTRLMVSVWPTINPFSENYRQMVDDGLLVRTEHGTTALYDFPDYDFGGERMGVSLYDPTEPRARRFIWEHVRDNYIRHGVATVWLDAAEPEIPIDLFANLRLAAGAGPEIANLYPREHARTFYEGFKEDGRDDIILLIRAAWAGSQRYGTLLWSGDIAGTWQSLGAQVRAGLNVAVSGIPWWTTDIGGFHGGDPSDEEYRELYLRWFQFGVFSPVLRAHGHREPLDTWFPGHTGGPNEIWSFGEETGRILEAQLRLRERLRPYIQQQFAVVSRTGAPLMRPLFLDFPSDDRAWEIEDQYLFGESLLVAPVLEPGVTEREVYLPEGSTWTDAHDGTVHGGGTTLRAAAPRERIPLFLRDSAQLPINEPPGRQEAG